jgi:3-keto-disaccharide hydrolase
MRARSALAIVCGALLLGCGGGGPAKGSGGSGGDEEIDGEGGSGGAGGSGGTPVKPSGGKPDSGAAGEGGGGGAPDAAPPADTVPPVQNGDGGGEASVGGPPALGMHLYDGMTQIFDGKTLDNWEQRPANSWEVKDGVMASKGSGRGYINTKADYGDYRLIFSLRQVSGDHQPCILIYGQRPPPNDALGAIQVQPPNGYTWDYRPGHNSSGAALFTKYPHPKLDAKKWNQCEVLVKVTGTFRFACCELTGTGPCKATEILKFNDASAGRKGPIAWQMHNGGIHDEYKDVWVEENPKVDDLISTK